MFKKLLTSIIGNQEEEMSWIPNTIVSGYPQDFSSFPPFALLFTLLASS